MLTCCLCCIVSVACLPIYTWYHENALFNAKKDENQNFCGFGVSSKKLLLEFNFRKLNCKLYTTKIYFSVIYESAAKCKFSDHDPAANLSSQRNKMRTKKQIWSWSCHWGFNAGGFFCRGPLEVRDSKNWQDTFDKEDKYISQWGGNTLDNLDKYVQLPIYTDIFELPMEE